jgi:hypothetical protein
MPTQGVQPTVLVKKADGTTERITLDELKKRQSAKTAPVSTSPTTVSSSTATSQQPKQQLQPQMSQNTQTQPTQSKFQPQSQIKSQTQPKPVQQPPRPQYQPQKPIVKPAIVLSNVVKPKAEPKTAEIKKEYATPLLHEKVPDSAHSVTQTSLSRVNQVDEIIKKLSFKVPQNLENRLRSLVQLRLKEIKGEEEVRDTALLSASEGGLGLNEKQTDELEKVIHGFIGKSDLSEEKKIAKKVETNVQQYVEPLTPAKDTPVNSFARKLQPVQEQKKSDNAVEKILSQSTGKDATIDQLVVPKKQTQQFASMSKPPSSSVKKPMNDVRLRPAQLGPVDEIKYFSLTDFRRLSIKPEDAAERLRQKFLNLKSESYILYMDAMSAWRESPLFYDYVSAVESAMKNNMQFQSIGADKENISANEILALTKMEKQLD